MRTCTWCGHTGIEAEDFYRDYEMGIYKSRCIPCLKKYGTMARRTRAAGGKLSMKEFKAGKMYL